MVQHVTVVRRGLAVATVLIGLSVVAPGTAAAACVTGTAGSDAVFATPGSAGCYIVPAGVGDVRVVLVGGRGGSTTSGGDTPGGAGAVAQGIIVVSPGEQLNLTVGADGAIGAGGRASRLGTLIVAGGGGAAGQGALVAGGAGGSAGALGVPGSKGGDDGSATGGGGGGPGTFSSGGAGGAAGTGNHRDGAMGGAGGLGIGGRGGVGLGGDGGDGYYGGGGGGSGGESNGPTSGSGGGGGGGAGSSNADPSVESFSVSTNVSGSPEVVIIAGQTAGLAFAPGGGIVFAGTQPQTTLGAPQTLTIQSTGSAPLLVDALAIDGTNPGDFLLAGDTCRRPVPGGSSCQVSVRFSPQASGPSSATLEIVSNAGSGLTSVPLSGTGGQLPQGATGPAGATGTTGAQGAQGVAGTTGAQGPEGLAGTNGVTGAIGATGPAGRGFVARCIVYRAHRNNARHLVHTIVRCAITGPRSAARATLTRGRHVYANGLQHGSKLTLTPGAGVHLTGGRYTLTLRTRIGTRTFTERRTVTIT